VSNLAALALAMAAQDDYTQGHARRVAAYAERLAQCLALRNDEVEIVRLGGLLHDIGKIAFSPQLLENTRAQLSDTMQAEIRRHPETGAQVLQRIGVARPVVDCVRHHHERIDGAGYPRGLVNGQIPLGAKIVSVADCYDALTTDRSYQARKNRQQALAVLKNLAGNALCPELVGVFCAEVRDPPHGDAAPRGRRDLREAGSPLI
jgi:putative nucleotidyltransferase with HDIG domain